MFSYEIYKISKNTFFIEQLQWVLLRFNSCFQRSPRQKPMRLSEKNLFAVANNTYFKNTYLEKQLWTHGSENQRQIFGMKVSYF